MKIISSGRSRRTSTCSRTRVATLYIIGTHILLYYNIQRDKHPRVRYYNVQVHIVQHIIIMIIINNIILYYYYYRVVGIVLPLLLCRWERLFVQISDDDRRYAYMQIIIRPIVLPDIAPWKRRFSVLCVNVIHVPRKSARQFHGKSFQTTTTIITEI